MTQEQERRAAFKACPILSEYLATALQDLQYTESDAACEEERDARDTGTIYTCSDDVLQWARSYCERFMIECAPHLDAVRFAHPGDDGFEYLRNPDKLSDDGIGSTLYLASVGHGVTFTDDGNHPALDAMAQWVRDNSNGEGLYMGDDRGVYAIG